MSSQTVDPESSATTSDQRNQDLGFGRVLSQRQTSRLLNRDGTFNVSRRKVGFIGRLLSYNGMLTMSWRMFFAVLASGYAILNLVFALGFWLCGPQALEGNPVASSFWRAFFFRVDTFATIGYGNIAPVGYPANVLVTFEAMVGLLSFALATGLDQCDGNLARTRSLWARH
ncbi:MAG: ion channel [Acidobacteriota bacterium]